MRSIVTAILLMVSINAFAQVRNSFDNQIRAREGMTSDANITASSSTMSANTGLFYNLNIRGATEGAPALIGDPSLFQIKIFVQQVGSNYYGKIQSATGIPLIFSSFNKQVQIGSGADITGGTTRIDSHFEVTNSPVRIVASLNATQALQLTRSATDTTGGKIYYNPTTQRVTFLNDDASGNGFTFDPPLTNDAGESITIYANDIVMDSTDDRLLTTHIIDTANSISWDNLLDSASATTIVEYVSTASDWILNHFDLIKDATGDLLPAFIEDRITSRLNSISDLTISGTFTAQNVIANTSLKSSSQTFNTQTYLNGEIVFGSAAVVIGLPTQQVDTASLQTQIDNNVALILQNVADISSLESRVTALENAGTGGDSANEYTFLVGGSASVAVSHNLATRRVVQDLRWTGAPYTKAIAQNEQTGLNTLTYSFGQPYAGNAFTALLREASFTKEIGNGADSVLTIEHSTLVPQQLMIWVYETGSPYREVYPEISISSATEHVFDFGNTIPTSNQYIACYLVPDSTQLIGGSATNYLYISHEYGQTWQSQTWENGGNARKVFMETSYAEQDKTILHQSDNFTSNQYILMLKDVVPVVNEGFLADFYVPKTGTNELSGEFSGETATIDVLSVSSTFVGDGSQLRNLDIDEVSSELSVNVGLNTAHRSMVSGNPHSVTISDITADLETNVSLGILAHSWGNHTSAGYQTDDATTQGALMDADFNTQQSGFLTKFNDEVYDVSETANANIGLGVNAYFWGDHSLQGYITDPNDSVSASELDGTFSTNGLLKRLGTATYTTITDNSANWNTAYTHTLNFSNPHSVSIGDVSSTLEDNVAAALEALNLTLSDVLTNGNTANANIDMASNDFENVDVLTMITTAGGIRSRTSDGIKDYWNFGGLDYQWKSRSENISTEWTWNLAGSDLFTINGTHVEIGLVGSFDSLGANNLGAVDADSLFLSGDFVANVTAGSLQWAGNETVSAGSVTINTGLDMNNTPIMDISALYGTGTSAGTINRIFMNNNGLLLRADSDATYSHLTITQSVFGFQSSAWTEASFSITDFDGLSGTEDGYIEVQDTHGTKYIRLYSTP